MIPGQPETLTVRACAQRNQISLPCICVHGDLSGSGVCATLSARGGRGPLRRDLIFCGRRRIAAGIHEGIHESVDESRDASSDESIDARSDKTLDASSDESLGPNSDESLDASSDESVDARSGESIGPRI